MTESYRVKSARARAFWSGVLLFVVALPTLVPAAGSAGAPSLRVGVGQTDITWHVGGDRLRQVQPDLPSDPTTFAGLHTTPHAKAIVIDGAERIALVRTDTILITGDMHEAVAQRVAALGIAPDHLMLAATHTHVSNNGMFPHPAHGAFYRSSDPREYSFLANRIADAVAAAVRDLRPATLAAGSGHVTLPGINRRYTNREKLGARPYANDLERIDPELGVLRFDDARTGAPIAIVMNYGLHPVVLIDNPLVSADFVAFAERGVEQAFPSANGSPLALWFNGAQGDQDPIYVRYSYPEAEWTGRVFAQEATRVARGLVPEPILRAAVAAKIIPVPPPGTPVATWQPAGPRVPAAGPSSLLIPTSVRLEAITLSTASASTVFMSWPGEPIRDIGISLKTAARNLGFDKAFVLGLANDWGGYFTTPEEYDRGGYEAETFSFYGREAAPYVQHHLIDLVRSLALGTPIEQVPLPPSAQADRVLISAIAAGGLTVGGPLASAEAPPPDGEVAVVAQPSSVARPGVVTFEWKGASPEVARGWIPKVEVQRLTGAGFVTVSREGTGDLLLYQSTPAPGDPQWKAVWEALPDTPAGVYRVFVEGRRQGSGTDVSYTLVSQTFEVSACACLEPGAIQVERADGRYRLSVGASYPTVSGGFRLITPRVASGRAIVDVALDGVVTDTLSLPFVSRIEPVDRTVIVRDVSGEDLPVTITEPTEVGSYAGEWTGPEGVSFRLVRVEDEDGNSN